MFPHERDHRIHGLHHFRENIIEIEVVACAPNQLLFTLHLSENFFACSGINAPSVEKTETGF